MFAVDLAQAQDVAPVPGDPVAALEAWSSNLAGITSISSDFVQEKHLALFRDPLIIRGHLFIETAGRFAWEVHWPARYKMVVADGKIRQWDEETDKIQTIALKDNPAAAAIHENMSIWFSGRYLGLTNTYTVTLASTNPVSFLLQPRDRSPAAAYLASVQVWLRDDGRYLDRVRIQERKGDRTEIAFVRTQLNQAAPADAWAPRLAPSTKAPPPVSDPGPRTP